MTVKDEGRWPWVRGFVQHPLDAQLYDHLQVMATQPAVQSAPTLTQLITWSGVPRELWYAPASPPKPTVDPQVAAKIADQVQHLKHGHTWQQIVTALGLSSVSAAMRMGRGDVHVNEVESVVRQLEGWPA